MATASADLDIAAIAIGFDLSTGNLSIPGDARNNTLQERISDDGYLQLMLDGQTKSSDPLSAFFDSRLQGATRDTLTHINFDGGEGRDTLLVGNQSVDNLEIAADDDILINGNAIAAGSLDVSADTITATGSLTGSKINLNSRDVLKLESGTKITSQDGDKGGTVHLLGKEVSLTGVAINASGVNGGGTVLIGGDYQGKGSVPNARTTFIDASTIINVDALQNGDGGRAIVWADDSTRFLGKINARGGSGSGDGGFAEVSGKLKLAFDGLVNLNSENGKVGTLLLEPEYVKISNEPGNYHYPDFPIPDFPVINATSLQNLPGNILIESTGDIIIDPGVSLNFVPGGSITFRADSDGNKTGRFAIDGTLGSNTATGIEPIRAPGRDVAISGAEIQVGTIDTGTSSGAGGDIHLSADNISRVGGLLSRSSDGNGGNISVVATGSDVEVSGEPFDDGDSLSIDSSGGNAGNGGSITLQATGQISTQQIKASANNSGNGGDVNFTSSEGGIFIATFIFSDALFGSAGNINLNAAQGIYLAGGLARSYAGEGGNITLTAVEGILAGSVWTYSSGSADGGAISLTSTDGEIDSFSLRSNSIQGKGDDIKVDAAKDILVDPFNTSYTGTIDIGEILSNSGGAGNGGAISLTSTDGNITTGALRSDSTQGTGGNIKIDAAKLVKVTGSENIDGFDYSIYTDSVDDASGLKGASVTINNSQKVLSTPSTFIIGDATTNGTFAGVSDGVATFDTSEGGIHAFVVDGDLNDIHVKMPTFIASSGSPALNSALDNVIKGMLPFLKGLSPSSTLTPLDQVRTLVSVLPQVTLQQVLQIAPDANPQKASQLLPYLNVAMAIYGINTPIRKSHFFAQLIQESDSFNATEEYADGSDYEGRRGLGNTEPGDGKRFKGRGLIQITGRAVYTDFSNHLGLGQTLLKLPQLVSTNPALATLSAGYFWKIFKGEDLSLKADQDIETNSEEILRYITQKVNGGLYPPI